MIDIKSLPSVAFRQRATLPKIKAVYIVSSSDGKVLYVGSTESLRARLKSHHRRFQIAAIGGARLAWVEISDVALLRQTERELIAELKPKLNGKPIQSHLRFIGTLVPPLHSDALKLMARNEERSVSKIVKKLLEDSPNFQEALKQVQAA